MNQKIKYYILMAVTIAIFASCDDYETYAEQKDRERSAINSYISKNNITVISEEQFLKQDTMTDVSKNEFVLFGTTGVYMQILDKGCGSVIKDGEHVTVLSRFDEFNILGDSIQLSNISFPLSFLDDKYEVTNYSGTFYASFDQGAMLEKYGSKSVPAGWLVPLSYVKLGRPSNDDESIARVRIIVPHDQGHSYASSGVYPCLYEISYMRGI